MTITMAVIVGAGVIGLLLVGFLAGWLVEWRIDLAYWRTYFQEAKEQDAANTVMVLPAGAATPQLPPSGQELLLQASREQLAQRDTDLSALRATMEQLNANEAHWRGRESELSNETRELRRQLDDLTGARNDMEAEWRHELARREQQWEASKAQEMLALTDENIQLKERLGNVQKRYARYKAGHPVGLANIHGIGPKIEAELSRAGVDSYGDLAASTPEELQRLLNPPKWRKLDYAAWIAEAEQLAAAEDEDTF